MWLPTFPYFNLFLFIVPELITILFKMVEHSNSIAFSKGIQELKVSPTCGIIM
jgi:hypothetical protein